jgi:hypothetical protein
MMSAVSFDFADYDLLLRSKATDAGMHIIDATDQSGDLDYACVVAMP